MLNLAAQTRHAQTLSPRLQHAVRLLQMSSPEFAAVLRDTLGSNPFLDLDDTAIADDADDADEPRADEASTGANDGDDDDRDLWHAIGAGGDGAQHAPGDGLAALETMAAETTLANHLHGQLNLLPLGDRERWLARAIIESLDDDGYLRTPLAELHEWLARAALEPAPNQAELLAALQRVQSLEPAGVAARSVAECLALQLPAITCTTQRALAARIVSEQLPLLAARDGPGLARRLGCSAASAEAACECIRRLDPHPGWRHGTSPTAYLVPDVVLKKVRGQWCARLNPAVVPKLRLNHAYVDLFQRHRARSAAAAPDSAMTEQLVEARWTLRNVDQRFATILDVANAIVRRQQHFFDYGAMAMKPLGLKEIADELGVHESTVSRVTRHKYMATPAGVFELKHFFSRAMHSANGSACSGTAVRSLVKDMIDAEQGSSPLSDGDITRQLGEQGLVLARRTVTKYRQMLKIDAVERRRRHP